MARQLSKRVMRRLWLGLMIVLVGLCLWHLPRWWISKENRYDHLILAAAERYGMDPALIKAVVWQESRFDPRAKGKAGEIGLMQITEATAEDWARAERLPGFAHWHLYDPEKNLLAGTWYLRRQLDRFRHTDQPAVYALAAYNAGLRNAARWATGAAATNSQAFLANITYPETRRYVTNVLARRQRYVRQFTKRHREPRSALATAMPRFAGEEASGVWYPIRTALRRLARSLTRRNRLVCS